MVVSPNMDNLVRNSLFRSELTSESNELADPQWLVTSLCEPNLLPTKFSLNRSRSSLHASTQPRSTVCRHSRHSITTQRSTSPQDRATHELVSLAMQEVYNPWPCHTWASRNSSPPQ